MSSQMGDALACPYISVTLMQLRRPEDHTRALLLSYQLQKGQPYQHAYADVDRYSPEWSILRAASEAFLGLEQAQQPITSERLRMAWQRSATEYVAPF